jgi:hypothetical protein
MDIDTVTDDIIRDIGKLVIQQEILPMADNATRIELAKECFTSLKEIVSDAKIVLHLHEPFKSMGYISIDGKNYSINNPALFATICKSASNIEVYPRTDGKVTINITFHKISEVIRGGEQS